MTYQKPLPKIPKHLAGQGVRWVMMKNDDGTWQEEILLYTEKEDETGFPYVFLKDGEPYFGKAMREIEPKEITKFKVGDRVQFKEWDEMTEEFGRVWHESQVYAATDLPFSMDNKDLCGTCATVVSISSGDVVELKDLSYRKKYVGLSLTVTCPYSVDMLKLAQEQPKEEECECCRDTRIGLTICDKCKRFNKALESLNKLCRDQTGCEEVKNYNRTRTIDTRTKTPYTAETFPCWAVWIAHKNYKGVTTILGWDDIGVQILSEAGLLTTINFSDIKNYEIASSTPDENGNIVWEPFYQLTLIK